MIAPYSSVKGLVFAPSAEVLLDQAPKADAAQDDGHPAGHVFAPVVTDAFDDRTRLAYCELHSAENARNVSITLHRAAAWFTEQGCGPVQAVMSDNAKCYATSHQFRQTRDRALQSFLRFYNRHRPHTAAGGRPPITRVH